MQKVRNIDTLTLDGGALCFHFINTVHAWRGKNLHEYLGTFEDVIKWCKKVNILNVAQRKSLVELAVLQPRKAREALQQLKQSRTMLYHFFSAIAAKDDSYMPPEVMDEFNAEMSRSFSHLYFKLTHKQVELSWDYSVKDFLSPMWLVMKSAYDILTTQPRDRIKECSKCGWIFLDNTKNNKRRWCDPFSCGSREKSKKYYQKIKQVRLAAN